MMAGQDFTPPEGSSGGDHAHTLARIALGLAPLIGGPAVELFNEVVTPPLEKRNLAWRQFVGERLNQLGDIEALQSNEVFISTLMKASAAAVKEHQVEKLEALRNAVLNAADPAPIDESKQQMFIHLIERLTVWHLRLLRLDMSPVAWYRSTGRPLPRERNSSSIEWLVFDAFPEIRNQSEFVDLLFRDLHSAGLCSVSQTRTMMSGDGAFQNRGTTIGGEFLRFIQDPQERKPG